MMIAELEGWAYSFDLLRWVNGAMDRQTDGQTNQWMDGRTIL